MKNLDRIVLAAALSLGFSSPLTAQEAHIEGDEASAVAAADDRVIRLVHFDLCWPASDEEYRALGKHAVLMLTASSVFPTDLPLASVYLQSDGATVPLQRIAMFDPHQSKPAAQSKKTRTTQVSFYLLPIHFVKEDSRLLVDFSGERKGFGVTTFSKKKGLDPRLPEFFHADKDDSPGKADMKAVQALLVREYPDYFH